MHSPELHQKIKQTCLTTANDFPLLQSLHSSQGNCTVSRWSQSILLQQLLKPTKFASCAAKVLQTLPLGAPRSDSKVHWDKSLPFSLGATCPKREVLVHQGSFPTPLLQGYWQNKGTSRPVRLNTFQRDSWRTFTPCDQCLTNFPSSVCIFFFFFLLWKVIQKYGYVQEEGEGALLESLSSVFGNFSFYRRLCPSRSNPPVVNCAPIPKMVPHSLNEQKCIGELVRAGCECLWGWRREDIDLSVLSRGYAALHSTLKK